MAGKHPRGAAHRSDGPTAVLAYDDHLLGPRDARLTLIEYGDYECPECFETHGLVRELLEDQADELAFAFRNFPLAAQHPHAVAAAEAAEAADGQGKFWLMHDRLFEHQSDLSDGVIRRIAEGLPLDMAHFDRELRSGVPARRVASDRAEGDRLGVTGTPTFFVNGRTYTGPIDLEPLRAALLATSAGKGP